MIKTSSYNYKWIVRIKAGLFMAGTHRFKTKKLAEEFVQQWKLTPENDTKRLIGAYPYYADLPIVEKEKAKAMRS